MSVRDELSLVTPRLRRYARGLTQASPAPSQAADELVQATVLRMLDAGTFDRKADLILQIFALLTQLNRENQSLQASADADAAGGGLAGDMLAHGGHTSLLPHGLSTALGALRLDEREALLLVVVEGFSYAQAARILHISRGSLLARLSRARLRLGEALAEAPSPQLPRRPAHLRLVK